MELISKLVANELDELGQYLGRRARAIVEIGNVAYADDVIKAINNLAGDHHYASGWLGGGTVSVIVSGLKSFSQVGDYLRAIKRVVPQLAIEDKQRQGLVYQCRIGVFRLDFHVNNVEATCRKVQVGTRMVEEPVYEIQCDEVQPVAELGPVFGEVDKPIN